MSSQQQSLNRKSSAPWDRLRPVKQDPLENYGYVSKGDNRLLNIKNQETFYHKITGRYMQFCAQHSKNLNEAFSSLTLNDPLSTGKKQDTAGLPAQTDGVRPTTSAQLSKQLSASKWATTPAAVVEPADELSLILTALRKLREGILATSISAPSPVFSQRVHIFNIRLAILALHPESYHASLRYLVTALHSREHPLPSTELREMIAYLVLDTALRLGDLGEAYRLRARAKALCQFRDREVDLILKATVTDNWPLFWRIRNRVDSYVRALMHWRLEALRKSVLKAIGKSYMKCDVDWILKSTTGNDLNWDQLIGKEDIGWLRDGDSVIIRKPKLKS